MRAGLTRPSGGDDGLHVHIEYVPWLVSRRRGHVDGKMRTK